MRFMTTEYMVLLGLCLVGLAIRTGYELQKRLGRIDTRSKPIFAVVLIGMVFVLASWPAMCPRDPLSVALPGAMRWLGLGGIVAGAALAVFALVQLRGVENVDHLVTTGIFSRLRHPMYLGFILWISGWVIRCGAAASLVAAILAIASILYWERLEEEKLEADYGEEYRTYRKATWC
jgi:protein-S-isoprenylcysteine O-methyltransferase Ste14